MPSPPSTTPPLLFAGGVQFTDGYLTMLLVDVDEEPPPGEECLTRWVAERLGGGGKGDGNDDYVDDDGATTTHQATALKLTKQ